MIRKPLYFCINQLVIGDKHPTLKDFEKIKDADFQKYEISRSDGTSEILSIKKIEKTYTNERFLNIYIEAGERFPYSEKVIDTIHLKEVENPRSADEIELTEQFFALVDLETSRIFLSNQKKKNNFIEWLQHEIGKTVIVKPLIKEDDFFSKIKTLDQVSFTLEQKPSGQGGSSSLSKELSKDILGFEAEEATLTLKYKKKKISDRMFDKIDSVLKKRDDFKDITIIGRTSDMFESIFNTEGIIIRLPVQVKLSEETQKVDSVEVFSLLALLIIKEENNARRT